LRGDTVHTVCSKRFRRRRFIKYEIDPPKLLPQII
jgi:hypothetical protein